MRKNIILFFLIFLCNHIYAKRIEYTILFAYNRYEIPDTAMLGIVNILSQYQILSVLIEGHCDSIGSKNYNYNLSENRANEVKKLLIHNGIEDYMIRKSVGFGKDRPLTLNQTDWERQLNRRVTILFDVTEKKKANLSTSKLNKKDTIPQVQIIENEKVKVIIEKATETKPEVKNATENGKNHIEKKETASKNIDLGVHQTEKPAEKKYTKVIEADKSKDLIASIKNSNIGDRIVFNNILFEPGRHILKPESESELQKLLEVMEQISYLQIEIQGHICCSTTEPDGYDLDTYTHNLSVNRAKEVYQFLINNGIDKNRMIFKGYGGSRKINQDESTEELRRINRRVEIKIIKLY